MAYERAPPKKTTPGHLYRAMIPGEHARSLNHPDTIAALQRHATALLHGSGRNEVTIEFSDDSGESWQFLCRRAKGDHARWEHEDWNII